MTESGAKRAKLPVSKEAPAKRILVVEDNLINQKVAVRMLAILGYAADIAENGADALQLIQQKHYDAILMDLQMPVMGGMEATLAIRRLGGVFRRIPIIAVTANALDNEQQKCLAAGMNDFLTKPIDRQKFASALERWTGHNKGDARMSA